MSRSRATTLAATHVLTQAGEHSSTSAPTPTTTQGVPARVPTSRTSVPRFLLVAVSLVLAHTLATVRTAGAADDPVWNPTGGPGGGQVRTALIEGTVALAGTIRGLYRSRDTGDTWSPVDTGIPATAFVVDLVSTGSLVLAATRDDGLFRSTDQGESWSSVSTGLEGFSVRSLATGNPATAAAIDNAVSAGTSSTIFALTNEVSGSSNLFRSTDEGASWELLPNSPSPFGVVAELNGVVIGNSAALLGMFRSTDGGSSWSNTSTGLPLFSLFEAMTIVGNDLFAGSHRDGIYHTTNDGQSWAARNAGLPQPFFEVNDLAADGTSILACFWGDGIYRSDDNGGTWAATQSGLPSGWGRYLFAVDSDNGAAIAGLLQDGAFRSTDSGDHWTEPSSGIAGTSIVDLLVTGGRVVATAGSDRIFFRDDLDIGWESTQTGVPATAQTRALGQFGTTLFAGTQVEGILRSLNQGSSWSTANSGYPTYNGSAGNQYREVGAFASTAQIVLVGTGAGIELIIGSFTITGAGIYRSTNAGASWQEANNGFPIIGTDNFGNLVYDPVIAMDAVDGVLLCSTFERGIFRSTNEGASWAPANSGLPRSSGSFPEFSGFSLDDGVISGAALGFAVGANGSGIFRSTDSGVSWSLANNGVPANRRITGLLAAAGSLLASVNAPGAALPDDGVYRSTDSGASWAPLGTGIESFLPAALVAIDEAILVGTAGFGVWTLDLLDPASILEEAGDPLVVLEAPVPNPAGGESAVTLALAESRAVRLTLHDASGRLLQTLHEGTLAAGRHSLALSAAELPAGVYYLALRDASGTIGSPMATRRLIVVH